MTAPVEDAKSGKKAIVTARSLRQSLVKAVDAL